MTYAELNEFVRFAHEFDVIIGAIECDLAKELKVFVDRFGVVDEFKLLTIPSRLHLFAPAGEVPLRGDGEAPCLWFGEIKDNGLKVKVVIDILIVDKRERVRLLREAVAVLIAGEEMVRDELRREQQEDVERREYERLKEKFG